MKYTPLHVHSHYSLLDGLSKPANIVKRLNNLELDTCAITDHGSVSGNVDFFKNMKAGKKKPILGCELYICGDTAGKQEKSNRGLTHLVVLAKNKRGWINLLRLITECNQPHNFYHKPRVSLDELRPFAGDLIAFSGHLGSHLASESLIDPRIGYLSRTDGCINSDAKARVVKKIEEFNSIFGKENFFIEIQLIDKENLPLQPYIASVLREAALVTGNKCIATPDAHYTIKEEAYDQRVLLCSSLNTTFAQVEYKLANEEDVSLGAFFKSDRYHIPSYDELISYGNTPEELANTNYVADMCESYDILSKPLLPEFKCPIGYNPDEYLRQLCREGWQAKIQGKIPKLEQSTYADRVKYELEVLQGAGLSSYFLMLDDIIKYTRSNGWLVGAGRGSAAGCLVSYLVGITSIDPLPYGLIFERFYNAGRNTKDRVAMPDIDVDIPSTKRERVLEYIKSVYGEARVGQISTFQTMKGRGALKEVLRSYGTTSFDMMNKITENIPDEAKIAGDLQTMKEEEGESSIVKWALENRPDKFSEWVVLKDDGTYEGPLAKRFEQAIRLEATKKAISKHASGVVVGPTNLNELCPMVIDKDRHHMNAGWEMNNLEDVGLIKFDILGVNLLSKMQSVAQILKYGDVIND